MKIDPFALGDAPVLMGIVNVTPDSFSDGGLYADHRAAIDQGLRLAEEGAVILDIGGESTRPGSAPVSPEEEIARVVPVIRGLRDCGVLLSVDTRNAATMRAAIDAGAGMINDVSALMHDTQALSVVIDTGVDLCLMHMQGDPKTMQTAPAYGNVLEEVKGFLSERLEACALAGVNRKRIVVDPGIGFGKNLDHNIKLLNNMDYFTDLGVPVMLGASRKSFIYKIDPSSAVSADQRIGGSIAACLRAYTQGIRWFRVHDVGQTRQALAVYGKIS